jgi:hypothetical protein
MRPQVLDATRVSENWFLVSPSMARHYQSEGGGVNGQFLPICGPRAGWLLRWGMQKCGMPGAGRGTLAVKRGANGRRETGPAHCPSCLRLAWLNR